VEYEHYAYIGNMALAKEEGRQIALQKCKIEIAKKLKATEMREQQIAEITELTIEEISKI
jgi:predicted transposase/invertase (TIGR01784 family)